jgi:hypothetical protein
VQFPDLPVIAKGETPEGERWCLSAAGTPDDYWTALETYDSDGKRWGSGTRGRALPANTAFAFTVGLQGDDKPLSVIIRAEIRIRRVRLDSPGGISRDLVPVADVPTVGVTFFVALLPPTNPNIAIEGFDAAGLSVATGGFDATGQLLRQRLT